jgi:hypothetical protein
LVIQSLPRIMLVLALLFLGTTLWSVSVIGFFELPRIDVEHFAAGAGDNLLIIRFFTALALAIGGVVWALGTAPMAIRASRAAIAPLVLILFGWSVVALDRFAPGYSEATFLNIVERHQHGEQFTTKDVQRLLGEPLARARHSSPASGQRFTARRCHGQPDRLVVLVYAFRRFRMAQANFRL